MDVTIVPLPLEDVPTIVDLIDKCFKDDKLIQATRSKFVTPEQKAVERGRQTSLIRERMSLPNNHYFKAIDAEGYILGFCGWHGPKPAGYQAAKPKSNPRTGFLPPETATKLAEAQKAVFAREKDEVWYLQAMSVDPDFQRQGIGSRLMEHGLETLVDRGDGEECFTESTPVAVRTYEKAGFESRTSVPLLDGDYAVVLMVRGVKVRPTTSTRPLYLLMTRVAPDSRAHFSIFVPNAADFSKDPNNSFAGTKIHVFGSPMSNFIHEFVRNYNLKDDRAFKSAFLLGHVDSAFITDPPGTRRYEDTTAVGVLEREVLRIDPPQASQNFMAPVNDVGLWSL